MEINPISPKIEFPLGESFKTQWETIRNYSIRHAFRPIFAKDPFTPLDPIPNSEWNSGHS